MGTNDNNLLIQGRIVWTNGDLFEGKQKLDYNTGQPVIGADGAPVKEYGFGLAIPKIDPTTGQPSAEYTKIWNAMHQEAFTLYPSGQLPPNFAMKYKDGDTIDDKGKPFADREGYANHIVLASTTRIPIKYFVFENGNNVLVNKGIKCGDYVQAQLNLKAHPAKNNGLPGLYINPGSVRLVQPGAEIINAPSGDQIFGAVAPTAIPGAIPPVVTAMPGVPDMAAAMGAPPNQAIPPAVATPHYGVLPPGHQPPPAAPVPAAPAYVPPAAPAYVPPAAPVPAAPAYVPPAAPVAPVAPVAPGVMPGNLPPVPPVR